MVTKNVLKYTPEKCESCNQTTTYAMRIDHGTADILLSMLYAVRRLGRNRVHLMKDMVAKASDFPSYRAMLLDGYMTPRMIGNATRARYHGLIAFADKPGEYVITRKGSDFLKGELVPLMVIVDKTKHTNAGYHLPAGDISIREVAAGDVYWEGATLELDKIDPTLF